MKFLYCLFSLLLFSCTVEAVEKKKVIVFTSSGGGGHISVASALSRYLQDYEVEVVNFAETVIPSLDLVKKISFGRLAGEELYNNLARWQWLSLTNVLYEISLLGFNFKQSRIEKLVSEYLINRKVDLVISVIPIINFALIKPLQDLNIPLLMLPTDLDISSFIQNMSLINYNRCKINLAFNIKEMREKALNVFKENQIIDIGFPIRPEFFQKYNKLSLKREFGIPETMPVIMILMGAMGSYASYQYVKALSHSKLKMHLLVCIGRNPDIERRILKINMPKNITMSIIGFTDKIPQLMTISDGIITKSGTISVCESLYMGLPILIDNTTSCLKWEKFNHNYIKSNNFGNIVDDLKNIESIIYNNIFKRDNRLKYKSNMAKLEKNDFQKNINITVKQLLEQ